MEADGMKKDKPEQNDEAICGPSVLRFASAPGFAQRRPKTEEEKDEHAADDKASGDGVVVKYGPCTDCRGL